MEKMKRLKLLTYVYPTEEQKVNDRNGRGAEAEAEAKNKEERSRQNKNLRTLSCSSDQP